jgi:hypothetical protein
MPGKNERLNEAVVMRPEKHQRVLERMGVSDGLTTSVRRGLGGKIRVTSALWEDAKVIDKHEVLEVRNVDGRLHIARKPRQYDEWDPPIEPYDPYKMTSKAAAPQRRSSSWRTSHSGLCIIEGR